jgi:hypothetical protein
MPTKVVKRDTEIATEADLKKHFHHDIDFRHDPAPGKSLGDLSCGISRSVSHSLSISLSLSSISLRILTRNARRWLS